jgi:hypothetical protein
MLSSDEIKSKIAALEAEAAKVGEPDSSQYRKLAMRWRLVAVEAVFMEAMRPATAGQQSPD